MADARVPSPPFLSSLLVPVSYGMSIRVRESRRAIRKFVSRRSLADSSEVLQNLAYWRSRSPEERIAAVEHLRRTHVGASARLQRSARVIQRPPG
jgi:hypothetical protein